MISLFWLILPSFLTFAIATMSPRPEPCPATSQPRRWDGCPDDRLA